MEQTVERCEVCGFAWTEVAQGEIGSRTTTGATTIAHRLRDEPSFTPMYRDERVDRGLYSDDTVPVVAHELAVAAALFARLFSADVEESLRRVGAPGADV